MKNHRGESFCAGGRRTDQRADLPALFRILLWQAWQIGSSPTVRRSVSEPQRMQLVSAFRISMVIPCCRTSMVSPGWMFSSRHNAAGIRTRRDVSTLHRTLFPAAVRICRSLLSGCTYISAIITRFSHKINTYCTKISAKDVLLVITEYEIALGKNIRKLRMERKLSQEQVSAQLQVRGCDVTRSALAKIEAGQRHLYPHELKALSIILAVPCDEILPNILE